MHGGGPAVERDVGDGRCMIGRRALGGSFTMRRIAGISHALERLVGALIALVMILESAVALELVSLLGKRKAVDRVEVPQSERFVGGDEGK